MFPPHSVHKSVTHYQLCVAELVKCVLVSDYKSGDSKFEPKLCGKIDCPDRSKLIHVTMTYFDISDIFIKMDEKGYAFLV